MNDDVPLLRQRPTINPYTRSMAEVARRLRWDLTYESWRSRRELRAWRNRFQGGKALILCNGPSLLSVEFGSLKDVFTFGLNKINLMFERTDFRPSCIAAVNPYVIEQNAEFFNETDIPLFLDGGGRRHVRTRESVVFLHGTNLRRFARDCSISVYPGYTVTFVAMQLAHHMGFREIALVGCDHNFATKGPANQAVTSDDVDPNHFDPNYFAGGVRWELPDLVQSEISYLMAGQVFEACGGRIVNCTDGGKLEVFPRMALADFLESKG